MSPQRTEGRIRLAQRRLQGRQGLERWFGANLKVHQGLGVLAHDLGEHGQGATRALHDPQHLKGAQDPIAGGRMVREDEVAGIFPAKGEAAGA